MLMKRDCMTLRLFKEYLPLTSSYGLHESPRFLKRIVAKNTKEWTFLTSSIIGGKGIEEIQEKIEDSRLGIYEQFILKSLVNS